MYYFVFFEKLYCKKNLGNFNKYSKLQKLCLTIYRYHGNESHVYMLVYCVCLNNFKYPKDNMYEKNKGCCVQAFSQIQFLKVIKNFILLFL